MWIETAASAIAGKLHSGSVHLAQARTIQARQRGRYGADLEFGLLGPLVVRCDGVPVPVHRYSGVSSVFFSRACF